MEECNKLDDKVEAVQTKFQKFQDNKHLAKGRDREKNKDKDKETEGQLQLLKNFEEGMSEAFKGMKMGATGSSIKAEEIKLCTFHPDQHKW